LGDWDAAEAERERLEAGFPDMADRPAACLLRANLARSRGELGVARQAQAVLREACGPAARPRLRVECHLLAADVTLASGDAAQSDREALEALRLGDVLAERSVRSRSRTRRVHALLVSGRTHEAVAEARRRAHLWGDGRHRQGARRPGGPPPLAARRAAARRGSGPAG
jgi:hypothetical protein